MVSQNRQHSSGDTDSSKCVSGFHFPPVHARILRRTHCHNCCISILEYEVETLGKGIANGTGGNQAFH